MLSPVRRHVARVGARHGDGAAQGGLVRGAARARPGNAAHGARTHIFLTEQIRDDTRLAAWARSVPATAMRTQPYWRLDDALLARWLLKAARFDTCPTEDINVRTVPLCKFKCIPERRKRACYTCDGIAPGIY